MKEVYNLGEQIPVSGAVTAADSINGFLKVAVECNGRSFPARLVPLNMPAGQRLFPSQIAIGPVLLSSEMEGECRVRVSVIENNVETEYGFSKYFTASNDLKASFRINEKDVQAGDDLTVTGSIIRLDSTAINGVAEVYGVFNDEEYLLDVVNIEEGAFSYSFTTKAVPAGLYTIEVFARDSYGNSKRFKAASYTLSNQLKVTAVLERAALFPGEQLKIEGMAKTVKGTSASDATAYASFDGGESAAAVVDGKFSFEIELSNAISSGMHTISVSAEDREGNSGSTAVEFSVTPVATSLLLDMQSADALPLGSIEFKPRLLDQADALLDEEIAVEITDSKRNVIYSGEAVSGKRMNYTLLQQALPGLWKLKASYAGLEAVSEFVVGEVHDLKIEVVGAVLTFSNTGNVIWRDDVEVVLEGEKGVFNEYLRKSIKPGEHLQMDLGKQAPTGTYKLTASLPGRTETFENFIIEDGKNVYSLNIVYIIMLLLVVGLIVYELTLLFKKGARMTPKLDKDDLHRLGKTVKSRVDAKTREDNEKKKLVDDYKRMTLEEIKRTEDKMKPAYPDKPWRKRVERKPVSKKGESDMGGAAGFFGGF